MKRLAWASSVLFAMAVLVGCAHTDITERQSNIGNEKLARPGRILVYDFGTSPADVPPSPQSRVSLIKVLNRKRRSRSRPAENWVLKLPRSL